MKCEIAQDQIVLMGYGELPDELVDNLEQHLAACEGCRRELNAMRALDEQLAMLPVQEPSPNLVAQSRMRLDEELDAIPAHGFFTRLRVNFFAWVGHLQSAPALATLLLGVGFISGNFTHRYQVAQEPRPANNHSITVTHPADGLIANVTGIDQTPNSELVQVHYNRVIPETIEGSLDEPNIRELLIMGMRPASTSDVRTNSATLLGNECRANHNCDAKPDGKGLRGQLMVTLRYDKDPDVRLAALHGLQNYVGQDRRVRDSILEALVRDSDSRIRTEAIEMLQPVQSDASVRQVFRTLTQDDNLYIRTASFRALKGSGGIQ
jgi:hypothetical protein